MHAALLVPLGRYSSKLHRAYSLFYLIGIGGAMQVGAKTPARKRCEHRSAWRRRCRLR
jgi:hypothetical protein